VAPLPTPEHFSRKNDVQQEDFADFFLLKRILPAVALGNSC
jgi:hypothetical protein